MAASELESLKGSAETSESFRIILDFLKWTENQRGLALCEPYKPQYGWYTPVTYQKSALVQAFLNRDWTPAETIQIQLP
jgi:hypothetical protein